MLKDLATTVPCAEDGVPTIQDVQRMWPNVVVVAADDMADERLDRLTRLVEAAAARQPGEPVRVFYNNSLTPVLTLGFSKVGKSLKKAAANQTYMRGMAQAARCSAQRHLQLNGGGGLTAQSNLNFNIAVHIRRGDVGPTKMLKARMTGKDQLARQLRAVYNRSLPPNRSMRSVSPDLMTELVKTVGATNALALFERDRYTPIIWYKTILPLLEHSVRQIPSSISNRTKTPHLHIFYDSDNSREKFNVASEAVPPLVDGRPNWFLHSSDGMDAPTTMAHLLLADLVVMAHSSFSGVPTYVVPRCALFPGQSPYATRKEAERMEGPASNYQLGIPVAWHLEPGRQHQHKLLAWLLNCLSEQAEQRLF